MFKYIQKTLKSQLLTELVMTFSFNHFLDFLEPTSISAWMITVLSNHSINSFLTCTPNYLIWTSSYELFQLKLKDLIEIYLLFFFFFVLIMNGHLTSAVQRRYSEYVFSPVVSGKNTNLWYCMSRPFQSNASNPSVPSHLNLLWISYPHCASFSWSPYFSVCGMTLNIVYIKFMDIFFFAVLQCTSPYC